MLKIVAYMGSSHLICMSIIIVTVDINIKHVKSLQQTVSKNLSFLFFIPSTISQMQYEEHDVSLYGTLIYR